jgi:G8 domain
MRRINLCLLLLVALWRAVGNILPYEPGTYRARWRTAHGVCLPFFLAARRARWRTAHGVCLPFFLAARRARWRTAHGVCLLLFLAARLLSPAAWGDEPGPLVRSARTGRWSEAATWEKGRDPGPGDKVQVRAGHVVTYDVKTSEPIRSIHVAGTLRFDPDQDTRLDVGLIKIQAGEDARESGFDCEAHVKGVTSESERAVLEVGTADRPIAAGHTALIRLAAVNGLDQENCPAIVCCGGRMDFHGAELSRAWVKLGATAAKGSTEVTLAEPVTGWRAGDRVILTATHKKKVPDEGNYPSGRSKLETEERIIRSIDRTSLILDSPLVYNHSASGAYRGEVANLSRNVVVESAKPEVSRGHTMYHRYSSGSISYAEFRQLGKIGSLGKYSLHFHRVGDTMRGSSVVGASIWDSGNRWLTIHGTNSLVVRECVGFRSVGHGFFLEDGTEVENILDGNLAVQALEGSPLPGQVFSFDRNEGAGFWWANSFNALMRNVAVECDQYGFRYEAPLAEGFDGTLSVRGSDDVRRPVDIRSLPFLRCENNEAHAQRRYGFNLGGGPGGGALGGVGDAGPDKRHPFVIRGLLVWDSHWAVSPAAPGVLFDGLDIARCDFGLWRPHYERHAYRNVKLYQTTWAYYSETGARPDPKAFPAPLEPVDDRPPVTVMTRIGPLEGGRLLVRGAAADGGTIRAVRVNGEAARSLGPNYSQWEVVLERVPPGPFELVAVSEDEAGNIEKIPHRVFFAGQ